MKTLSSNGNNTSDTIGYEAVTATRFDTGDLENLDSDGADVVKRRYTKDRVSYAKVANIGHQV